MEEGGRGMEEEGSEGGGEAAGAAGTAAAAATALACSEISHIHQQDRCLESTYQVGS